MFNFDKVSLLIFTFTSSILKIERINEAYINVIVKPIFNVTSSAISVTLPVIDQVNLSNKEKKVLESMKF